MKSYFDSIHNLPIYHFDLINKSGDYQHLMRDYEKKAPSNVNLERIWVKIYDEYLLAFGLSETYEDWMRTRIEAAKYYRKAYIDDQKHFLTFARIKEEEAKQMIESISGGSLIEMAADISKYMGFRVNIMEITTAEFYSYINKIKKDNSLKNAKNTV